MDQAVVKYYRAMLRKGFEYVGSLENPTIFLDTVGEKIRVCGHTSNNYMHIYISILDGHIDDIKYLCTCDPTANVVVEVLCGLIKGQSVAEAAALSVEDFRQVIGGGEEEFVKKVKGVMELLNRGLGRYQAATTEPPEKS